MIYTLKDNDTTPVGAYDELENMGLKFRESNVVFINVDGLNLLKQDISHTHKVHTHGPRSCGLCMWRGNLTMDHRGTQDGRANVHKLSQMHPQKMLLDELCSS